MEGGCRRRPIKFSSSQRAPPTLPTTSSSTVHFLLAPIHPCPPPHHHRHAPDRPIQADCVATVPRPAGPGAARRISAQTPTGRADRRDSGTRPTNTSGLRSHRPSACRARGGATDFGANPNGARRPPRFRYPTDQYKRTA